MRLLAWRRQHDLLELLKVASIERFRDPAAVSDTWTWNDNWHRIVGRVIDWAHKAPNKGRKQATFDELSEVVHEARHWRSIEGAIQAVASRRMKVEQEGRRYILTMASVPDLEFLDMLLEHAVNPSVPSPPFPRRVQDWYAKRARSGRFEELDDPIWHAILAYARKMLKWQRSSLPEGMIDDDLELTRNLTLGRSLDLYAALLALRIVADSAVRVLNYSEASLMSFTKERALQFYAETGLAFRDEEVTEFIELMTYRPGQGAHASATPFVPFQDRLIFAPALVTSAGVERTLLRSVAMDPNRFGSLGQRLGRLADRVAYALDEIPGVSAMTRIKAVRPDGSDAGDIDVLAIDKGQKKVFAVEVKWPVEALTLKEAAKVDADVRRGSTQLSSLRLALATGAATLALPPETIARDMDWTWFVATPAQLSETGIEDIHPTSLRHLRAMLPSRNLNDLEAKLRQRPQLGKHFKIGHTVYNRLGLWVRLDTIEAQTEVWEPLGH
jgi:hypothetical protein